MQLTWIFTKRLIFAKKTIFFACLPLLIACMAFFQPTSGYNPADFFEAIQIPVLLLSMGAFIPMYCGTRALGEEIESHMTTYLFTRPCSKLKFTLTKFIAATVASCWILIPAALLSCIILSRSGGFAAFFKPLLLFSLILIVAAVVYCAFFLLLGVSFKRPTVIGLVYLVIWESAVSHIPGSLKDFTIMYHVQSVLLRAFYYPSFLGREVVLEKPAGQILSLQNIDQIDAIYPHAISSSLFTLLGITLSCLALSWFQLRRKEFY